MPQRPQYILEAFAAAGHPVWFVDPRISEPEEHAERIRLVSSVAEVPPRDVIIYCHFAPLSSLIRLFENSAVVYDILDDLAIYDPDEGHLPEEARVRFHHGDLVDSADIITVSNPVLAPRHAGARDDVLVVENGVDLERFTPDGPVTRAGRSPVIGYHGAVAEWFDFELMSHIADLAPDLEFVLVGPVYDRVSAQMEALVARANVTHIPRQSGEKIPEYVRGFDVGLIPFLIDEMTEGVTPLKMYEYMACGIPVVSTPLPACVEHPGVASTDDPSEFVEQIRTGIRAPDGEKDRLKRLADQASWDHRLAPVLRRLEELGVRSV